VVRVQIVIIGAMAQERRTQMECCGTVLLVAAVGFSILSMISASKPMGLPSL
jgi:hypothetical protein